jgi:hypothetical protein
MTPFYTILGRKEEHMRLTFARYMGMVTRRDLARRSSYTPEYLTFIQREGVPKKARVLFNLLAKEDGIEIDYESVDIEDGRGEAEETA